jgi:hypothetical protein
MHVLYTVTALYVVVTLCGFALGVKLGVLCFLALGVAATLAIFASGSEWGLAIAYGLAFGWPVILLAGALGAITGDLLRKKHFWIVIIPIAIFIGVEFDITSKERMQASEQESAAAFTEADQRLQLLIGGRVYASLAASTAYTNESKGKYEFVLQNDPRNFTNPRLYAVVDVDRSLSKPVFSVRCVSTLSMGARDSRDDCQGSVKLPVISLNDPQQAITLKKAQADASICKFVNFQLPPSDFELWLISAATDIGGQVGFQIDPAESEAIQIDVNINRPGKKIALVLMQGNSPTIWNIRHTNSSIPVAILAYGSQKTAIAGVDDQLQVILASQKTSNSACKDFFLSRHSESARENDQKLLKFFGKKPDNKILNVRNTVNIGVKADSTRLISNPKKSPIVFKAENTPFSGKRGLDDAIAAGSIRPMTEQDAIDWVAAMKAHVAATGVSEKYSDWWPDVRRGYVVLKPVTVPATQPPGAVFLLKKNVSMTSRYFYGNTIFDENTMKMCDGSDDKCLQSLSNDHVQLSSRSY